MAVLMPSLTSLSVDFPAAPGTSVQHGGNNDSSGPAEPESEITRPLSVF